MKGKVVGGLYVDQNIERAEEAERELEAWAFRDQEMYEAKPDIDFDLGPVQGAPSRAAEKPDIVPDSYTVHEEADFLWERMNDRRKD